jgi:hypothetical protein
MSKATLSSYSSSLKTVYSQGPVSRMVYQASPILSSWRIETEAERRTRIICEKMELGMPREQAENEYDCEEVIEL